MTNDGYDHGYGEYNDDPVPGMGEPAEPKGEPVATAQAVNALIVIGAALGWTFIDSALINAIITLVALGAGVWTTLKARSNVKTLV